MALGTRTIVIGLLGAVVVGGLGFVAFRTEPVPVDLHAVDRGPMQVTIDADGKTRIAEIYEVASPITGTALRAPVRVGDPVVAGETVVAVVEPVTSGLLDARTRIQAEAAVREAEAGLYVARSEMRQAEEDLVSAQSEYNRARTLVDRGVASLTRLEDAERRLGVAKAAEAATAANLERAMGALDRARAALIEPGQEGGEPGSCCMRLTAPIDGRVLDIDVISERPVTAGTRLLSLGDPNDLEIVADLLSADAVRIAPGNRTIVERWGGDTALEARVRRIEPSAYTKISALGIEEQRVDVIFDIVTPPEDRPQLGDGFAVFLRVVEWSSDDELIVPLSALFRRGERWAVFVVDAGGTARLRNIEIGRRNTVIAQLVSGLEEGEQVILHPSDAVADGSPVIERGID